MVQSKLVQASMRFDVEEFAQCIEQYTDKEFEKIIAERNIKLD